MYDTYLLTYLRDRFILQGKVAAVIS